MKTRNIIALLAALPIIAGFTGCKSDDETEAKPAKEILRVQGGDIEFRADEEGTVVNVAADCHWKVQDLDAGDFGGELTIQPREGSGNGTLVITTDQNTTTAGRHASFILISDGGLKQKVNITQTGSGDGLNLSRATFKFDAQTTAAQALTITSNTNWTIQIPSGVDWLHIDKTSGSAGAEVVQLTVDDAVNDVERTTQMIVLYGSGKSAEVSVTQEGMNSEDIILFAEPEQLTFEAHPGENMMFIESNAQWQARIPSSVTWARIEGGQSGRDGATIGVGNSELRIFCEENPNQQDRTTAIVIMAGTKNPKQCVVVIEQRGTGVPEPQTTVGELYSLYVSNKTAEFHYSFVSDDQVEDYGLVYSRDNDRPSRDNSESVVSGHGGLSKSVLAELEGLEPSTTYYVRAWVQSRTKGVVYSPNMVTIKTSASDREPGESDNPNPTLSPKR